MTPEKTKQQKQKARRREYQRWLSIIARCHYPKSGVFHLYGAKGIKLHEPWHDFNTWIAEVGYPPSDMHHLARIDTTKNYQPGNLRWSTRAEQLTRENKSRGRPAGVPNKLPSKNSKVWIYDQAQPITITRAAITLGMNRQSLTKRLKAIRQRRRVEVLHITMSELWLQFSDEELWLQFSDEALQD